MTAMAVRSFEEARRRAGAGAEPPDDPPEWEAGDAFETSPYPKARKGSRLLFAGDLFDRKPQQYIVHGMLPENSLVTVYGKRASFKTFAVTDMVMTIGAYSADEVAAGARMTWWGRPVRHGVVVYVVAEGADGWASRMAAWMTRHNRQECSHSVAVLPEPANLQDPKAVANLILDIKYAAEALGMPVVLVVFDTLFRCYGGCSMSGDDAAGAAIAAVDRVRREIVTTVLLVSHSNANGDSFGSKMLPNSVDAEFVIERDGKSLSATFRAVKVKDDEEPSFTFHMSRVPVLHPVTGLPVHRELPDGTTEAIFSLVVDAMIETSGDAPTTSVDPALKGRPLDMFNVLVRSGSVGLTFSEWWTECNAVGIKSKDTFNSGQKLLLEKGYVKKTNDRFTPDLAT